MSDAGWRKLGGWSAIVYVVLEITGQMMFQVGGGEPAFNAPAAEVVGFFTTRDPGLVSMGGYLVMLASVAFLWFLGSLWATLREAESPPAWLSLVAVASAVTGLASSVATAGSWPIAVFRMHDDPALAMALFDTGNFGFANSWVWTASFLLATAVVALRSGVFSRVLGWGAVVTAVLLLLARAVWAAPTGMIFVPLMLYWVWLIAVGVVLIRRPGASPPTEATLA